MSRLVERDATGPRKLQLAEFRNEKGNVAVCQCGLSGSHPFCDGSHRATREEGGELYRYDDGERRVVAEVRCEDE